MIHHDDVCNICRSISMLPLVEIWNEGTKTISFIPLFAIEYQVQNWHPTNMTVILST